jgi:sigma-B regulation protein RsbQ
MSIQQRNNVHVMGEGPLTMVFSHGFGCDQNMWRLIAPQYASRFRTVTFDLVGAGGSDLSAYDVKKYDSLSGYADDLLEIIDAFAQGPVVFVGHSVSAMVGLLAGIRVPEKFIGHVMVGPSPCYISDGDYVGGFTRDDIHSLLDTLDSNYLGWASSMAPTIMGAPNQPELGVELKQSFCRTDPAIAKQFAHVTFLSDNRADLPKLQTPTLIVQSSDDFIAPVAVGEYLQRTLPNATLRVVDNVGHCPHLSAPCASADAVNEFLAALGH